MIHSSVYINLLLFLWLLIYPKGDIGNESAALTYDLQRTTCSLLTSLARLFEQMSTPSQRTCDRCCGSVTIDSFNLLGSYDT